MKPKVIVLTTGGTIGHRSGKDGVAVMNFDPAELAAEAGVPEIELQFRAIFRKGSMDVVPDDWVKIATAVADAQRDQPRGVVILHGTDTMHYTASALSFMLRGLSVPVVMTGSMIPGGNPGSDALPNLRDAILVAAYADLAEVCVVFSADLERTKALIIRGTRARKMHSHGIVAFDSINAPPLGDVVNGKVLLRPFDVRRRAHGELTLATGIEQNVVLLKLNPALTPDVLARQLQGAAGAVLEGTGVGHIKTDLQGAVAAFGKPAVITTQTVYGGECLGSYDVDKAILAIPNIIPTGDMHSDAAFVKLMWALGQGGDVRSLMRTNVAGEIGGAA